MVRLQSDDDKGQAPNLNTLSFLYFFTFVWFPFYNFQSVFKSQKWIKFQRDFENFRTACIPWERKIKEVESKCWQHTVVFTSWTETPSGQMLSLKTLPDVFRSLWIICGVLLYLPALDVRHEPGAVWFHLWTGGHPWGEIDVSEFRKRDKMYSYSTFQKKTLNT